jgi:hypothetical protein
MRVLVEQSFLQPLMLSNSSRERWHFLKLGRWNLHTAQCCLSTTDQSEKEKVLKCHKSYLLTPFKLFRTTTFAKELTTGRDGNWFGKPRPSLFKIDLRNEKSQQSTCMYANETRLFHFIPNMEFPWFLFIKKILFICFFIYGIIFVS